MCASNKILLSFDTEEFDGPREHGVDFSLEQGMAVSIEGTNRILEVLDNNHIKATFFCTGNFATHAPEIIHRIIDQGHEIACHGVDHWQPSESDITQSKIIVERVAGIQCNGYRQPRMFPVDDSVMKQSGYLYNSSLNPAFIPGRYMHLTDPRTWFIKDGVMQIPASVTPYLRFPLFWLSLHILPENWYFHLVKKTLRHDGYFVTYFHPWEFYDLKKHPEFKMPYIIKMNSGTEMMKRLNNLIDHLQSENAEFITFTEFVNSNQ